MGSPLSPIISDLVMRDLEERALETLGLSLPFYFRYVDDIVMAIPSDSINKTLNTFNNLHPRLQFTLEMGGDKINFLDVTIIKNNKKLEFNWYHKPHTHNILGEVLKLLFTTPTFSEKRYHYGHG